MVMQDGRISESGTYHELLLKDGNFADFLSTYLEEEEIEIGEETSKLILIFYEVAICVPVFL